MDTQKKLHPSAKTFIECKARQLVGKCGLLQSDIKDIEQELYTDLFRRIAKFNSDKAKLTTFIQRVVEHKIANILRDRCSGKSVANRQCLSLDSTVQTDDSTGREITLGDCVSHDQFERFVRGKTRSCQEERELIADVRQVVGRLPKIYRRLVSFCWKACQSARRPDARASNAPLSIRTSSSHCARRFARRIWKTISKNL